MNLGDSYSAGTRLAHDTTGGIAGNRRLPADRRPAPLPPKKPDRGALAGRVRPAGIRLDFTERGRVGEDQSDARIGPRPAVGHLRNAVHVH